MLFTNNHKAIYSNELKIKIITLIFTFIFISIKYNLDDRKSKKISGYLIHNDLFTSSNVGNTKFFIHLTQRYKSKKCNVFFIPSNKNASFLLKKANLNNAYLFTSYVFNFICFHEF